jgi:DNA-binding CsgD family transcriptional regulator/tetratricopeptide (TPR) repeat protein
MDLLERADALGALDDVLAASASGGRIALISGEAGAGKSTLAGAFAARVGGRARVLWGACDPLLTPRALGPLHDIAGQVGGELAERLAAMDSGGRRHLVFDALLRTLDGPGQRARPVLVVEDAHWADEASLDLLAFLGRRLARYRAVLLLTYRDDEVGAEHPLHSVLAGLPSALVRRVPLAPLSPAAVAELAGRAGRDATGVHRVTGGNPLLVAEVLAAAGTGVPATVRDLVLARLAALSPPARELAHLVAVVPSRIEPALLRALSTDDPGAAVDECLTRGLLVAVGSDLGYRHELLRRAVEEALSPVRRAALHARVLAALAQWPHVDPARLVHHAHHAGDAGALLRWAPVAARGAATVGAHRQAAAHYATALPLADRLPPDEHAELLEGYSFSAYLAGMAPAALTARREALALREGTGDAEHIGENLRWLSRLCWWTGQGAAARENAERAVRALERVPPGRQLAMAYSNQSQLAMLANEAEPALAWGDRALRLARQLDDVETEAHALINVGSAKLQRGNAEGVSDLERAHDVAVAAGLDDHAARALVNLAGLTLEYGDYPASERAFERALPFTIDRDLDGYARHLLGSRALLRLVRGDWGGAASDAGRALDGVAQVDVSLAPALVALGRLAARRGEPDPQRYLDRAMELAEPTGEIQYVGPAAAALAERCWLAGDPDGARAAAGPAYDLALRVGHPWHAGELGYRLWLVGEPIAPDAPLGGPYRLMVAGDWAGAAAEWERLRCPYPRAEALADGDPPAAGEALAILDRLGAVATARRLRARLRERGMARVPRGPRPATAAHPTGLTARQLEVLGLLADGLTNAEIAARLSVSAKTVDHHVSGVLAKFGVATRGQAVAAALRAGILPAHPAR